MARDQARSAPTYKDPGSCYLKYFPEKPPSCSLGLSGLSLVCEYVQTPWERRIRATPSKTDFDVLHGFTFQKAATANWHCRFLQRLPLQSEAKLLVTGHRPRHDLAAGLCAIPDVAVTNIPTECWFIQKFKDEISHRRASAARRAVWCREYSLANFRSLPRATHARGWCKVAAYDILRRKEVVKISEQRPPDTGKLNE